MQNNSFLENLQNRVVQEAPVKLLYAESIFNVFNRGNVEFYGAYGEWVGDQPLEGVEWSKDLTSADLNAIPDVFSCRLPIILNKFYYTIVNKREMKKASQDSAYLDSLTDRLIESVTVKAQLDLNKKLTQIISNPENYKAVTEISAEEANVDSKEKAMAALKLIRKASSEMLEPSKEFNKGYQIPGDDEWNNVETNCKSRKSQVLTIDPDYLDGLEIYFLSRVENDSALNPRRIFKEVIEKKLPKGILCMINDEKNISYEIINEEGMTNEKIFGSGNTKIGYQIEVIGGMIPFTNGWMLKVKNTEEGFEEDWDSSRSYGTSRKTKNLAEHHADLGLSEEQAQEWKEEGFSYSTTKKWLEIDEIEVSDAKFIRWFSKEKLIKSPTTLRNKIRDDSEIVEKLKEEFEKSKEE